MSSLFNTRDCLAGARDTLPMLVGAAPFGVIFGTLAVGAGLPPWAAQAMSLLVYAGSSQFVAVSLVSAGTVLPVIWLTTFIINLRHALYSATLLPTARTWSLRWRAALAFWLTDETFAVVEHRFRTRGEAGAAAYQLGSSLAMYLNWQFFTLVGIVLGKAVPGLADWGLDFAMVATFTAIVAPQLRQRPALAAAATAGALALLCRGWPYKLDLIVAVTGGMSAAMAVRYASRRSRT